MYNTIKDNKNGTSTLYLFCKGKSLEAIIDTEDVPKLEGVRWGWHRTEKLVRGQGIKDRQHFNLKFHLLGLGKCSKVKHKNGNQLDCRKSNLVVMGAKAKCDPVSTVDFYVKSSKIAKLQWLARELTTEINLLAQEKN